MDLAQRATATGQTLAQRVTEITMTEVKYARVVKCYTSELSRIELSSMHDSAASKIVLVIIRFLVTLAGGVKKENQAPRGKLERRISEWIKKGGIKSDEDAASVVSDA